MKIISYWKDFFAFLKKPIYTIEEDGYKDRILLALSSFVLKSLLIIPITIAFTILFSKGDSNSMFTNVTALYHPLVLAIIVAVFEEFSFRSALSRFNPMFFAISISGVVVYFIKKIVFRNMFFEPEGLLEVSLIAIVLFSLVFLVSRKYKAQLITFWQNNFALIFYASAFLFAFVHFFNFETLELSNFKMITSQFVSALILGFVRIRSGLFYAIILHFIWDFIAFNG